MTLHCHLFRCLSLCLLLPLSSVASTGNVAAAVDEQPPSAVPADDADKPPAVPRAALRQELLERVKKDQDVRMRLIAWMREQTTGMEPSTLPPDSAIVKEMSEVDARNRDFLRKQVDESGWPGASQVGQDGAHAAWLLLQHADDDPPFQERCLALMKQAPAGDVDSKDLAMLTDRVMIKKEGKQLYGTQVRIMQGKCEVLPLAEPDRVDELRQEVGFPPLAEYLKFVEQMYIQRPNDTPAAKVPPGKEDH